MHPFLHLFRSRHFRHRFHRSSYSIFDNFYMNSSVLGLILLMRQGSILKWLEQPGIFNLTVNVQDFHGIHIPCINAEFSYTTVWLLFFQWPPIASTFRQRILANPLRSINDEPIETYTHPHFSQKLNEISLSPQTYWESLAPSLRSNLISFTL